MTNLLDVVFRGNPFTLVDGEWKAPKDRIFATEVWPQIKQRIPSVDIIDGEFYVAA